MEQVLWKNLADHEKNECSKRLVDCTFVKFDCNKKITTYELNNQVDPHDHLQLVTRKYVNDMYNLACKYKNDLKMEREKYERSLKVEKERSAVELNNLKLEIAKLKKNHTQDQKERSDNKVQLAERDAKINVLTAENDALTAKTDDIVAGTQVELAEKEIEITKLRTSQISSFLIIDNQNESAELSKRLGNNGFIWNIKRVNEKREREKAGLVECQTSPSFYTSVNGYHVQLLLYFNGQNKDGNVSLFARIVKGANDEELEWPCKMKITTEAVSHTGNNVMYTFDFGKCTNWEVTRRPEHHFFSKNFGVGSLNLLVPSEVDRFIKSDQLTIKCYLATDEEEAT